MWPCIGHLIFLRPFYDLSTRCWWGFKEITRWWRLVHRRLLINNPFHPPEQLCKFPVFPTMNLQAHPSIRPCVNKSHHTWTPNTSLDGGWICAGRMALPGLLFQVQLKCRPSWEPGPCPTQRGCESKSTQMCACSWKILERLGLKWAPLKHRLQKVHIKKSLWGNCGFWCWWPC